MQTVVLLKPDCVSRGIVGEVTSRFEKKGMKLVACKMSHLSTETLTEHYGHLADKPFFPSILAYMQASPVVAMVWEGENVVPTVRKLIGLTNPLEADLGTVRGDFALTIGFNIVHASETEEEAVQEIKRFFNEDEIFAYDRLDASMIS